MSAATNDTNNNTTRISIAVPDRLLGAINWAVSELTEALDETLTQYVPNESWMVLSRTLTYLP